MRAKNARKFKDLKRWKNIYEEKRSAKGRSTFFIEVDNTFRFAVSENPIQESW